jgi:hypothetical protein
MKSHYSGISANVDLRERSHPPPSSIRPQIFPTRFSTLFQARIKLLVVPTLRQEILFRYYAGVQVNSEWEATRDNRPPNVMYAARLPTCPALTGRK